LKEAKKKRKAVVEIAKAGSKKKEHPKKWTVCPESVANIGGPESVKVQTPLARLKHCCDTSWPLPGPTRTHKGTRQDGWTTRVRCEREEEE